MSDASDAIRRLEAELAAGKQQRDFLWRERKEAKEALIRTEAELAEARADIVAAAGELLVPVPEPGTNMGRVMLANVAMRRERDNAARNERLRIYDRAEALARSYGEGAGLVAAAMRVLAAELRAEGGGT